MRIDQVPCSVVDAVELPRLIQLDENLFAACFFLMKLLPAKFILDRARDAGMIQPGSTVIETTSGTFGLALAIYCALNQYRLILVGDPAIDEGLKRRLEDLGARVEIVTQPAIAGGFQRSRLDRMAQLQAENPGHFCPSQYDNPHNPGAYAPLAELLVESLGSIDCLVGSVGSGGSTCGTSKYLRLLLPHLQTIGVDTHGSVLFGQADRKRMLRGLGNSLMPGNVTHTVFDEIHWVSAAEAFRATRLLYQTKALYMGGTSGAAYMVANWWAKRHPERRVVVLFPDEGYRYEHTIYNDQWLRANDLWLPTLPTEPRLVTDPRAAGPNWSNIIWNRRTYQQVMGRSYGVPVVSAPPRSVSSGMIEAAA
jgi:cysteine synthase A